jgi:membrane fusion protein (multidrug efflux system)
MPESHPNSTLAEPPLPVDRPLDLSEDSNTELPAADNAPATTRTEPTPAPATPARKKRGPVFWIVTVVLGIGAAVWLVDFVAHAYHYESTDDAYVAGHVHQISPQAAGAVTQVLVDENVSVAAGQVLARIDPLEYEISLHRAQANLAEAKADEAQAHAAVDQSRAQVVQLQAQVSQAEAQVAQAQARLSTATEDFNRNNRLYSSDDRAIAKSEVDTTKGSFNASQAALNAAQANAEGARSNVVAAQAQVEASDAKLAAAQAKVAASDAAVHDAERELSYTTVSAPVAGRIGNKNVESGNRVQVGQALFALVEPDLWVTANFKETELAHMQPGQSVSLTLDAIPGHEFVGHVDSISPATGAQFALLPPDNATGNFTKVVQRVPVKIVFDRDSVRGFEDRLRPGLSAVVDVRIR